MKKIIRGGRVSDEEANELCGTTRRWKVDEEWNCGGVEPRRSGTEEERSKSEVADEEDCSCSELLHPAGNRCTIAVIS